MFKHFKLFIMRKTKTKTIMLSMAMAIAMTVPVGAMAQKEGLFQRGTSDESFYGNGSTKEATGMLGNRSVEATGQINNQVFGQPVPLGSGVLLLLSVSAGYAILKRKEDEK